MKFEHEEIILGSLVVDGKLPDIEVDNYTLLWGNYPPARIGLIDMDNATLKGPFIMWPSVLVERRWLFLRRYTAELWMGQKEDEHGS